MKFVDIKKSMKKKPLFKILFLQFIVCATFLTLFNDSKNIYADELTNNISTVSNYNLNDYGVDTALLEKILTVGKHINFAKDGKALTTDLSDEELIETYKFTNEQLLNFHKILSGTYVPPKPKKPIYPDRAKFYISNNQLKGGVFVALTIAAEQGPAALAATFTSLASLMGPLGTVIGAGISVLGTGFFIDAAIKIAGAVSKGKGLEISTQWGFPPVQIVIK